MVLVGWHGGRRGMVLLQHEAVHTLGKVIMDTSQMLRAHPHDNIRAQQMLSPS